ncbi:MAG: DUF1127 domain-containing protein, partial [Pseudomonadota bacterium]
PIAPPRQGHAVRSIVGSLSALWRSLRAFAAYLQERRQAVREYHQLHEMPDHLLRDIGLSREDLIAAQLTAWSERPKRRRGRNDLS